VTRDGTTDTAGAPDASTQGVTLSIPTHMATPSHGLILREGPKPTRPRGRIPRVARLLALAYHFEELLKTGAVESQAELADLAKLTPARVTQGPQGKRLLQHGEPDLQELRLSRLERAGRHPQPLV
jgi:thiamine pyrophosphate-dependent acetolactate synthase large subunit-like protein